jgi:hypothetical protein
VGAICGGRRASPEILEHVAGLHDEHEKDDEERVPAFVARNLQRQQRRHVRDAEHADHEPALQRRRALACAAPLASHFAAHSTTAAAMTGSTTIATTGMNSV